MRVKDREREEYGIVGEGSDLIVLTTKVRPLAVRPRSSARLHVLAIVLLAGAVGCKAPPPTTTKPKAVKPVANDVTKAPEVQRRPKPPEKAQVKHGGADIPSAKLTPPSRPLEPMHAPAFDRPHLRALSGDRSYSIGTASRGYLVGARAMNPHHPCLKIRPVAKTRKAYYGTVELITALERVACRLVKSWPGTELYAGDLSGPLGGDIPGHASHNSGRDADIPFFMRDKAGRLVSSHRMIPIRADGRAKWGNLTFDTPRNWALVEELLREPQVQVQYLFIANRLKRLLIAYAEAKGVDGEILKRAKRVLKQPRDSSIHAEHFHLRIYCGLAERLEGCVDYGRVHPWIKTYDREVMARVGEVLPFLRSQGDEEVRFAITRIVRLRAKVAVEHLEPLLTHRDQAIAALAGDAIAFLRGRRTPPRWSHLTEEDPGE